MPQQQQNGLVEDFKKNFNFVHFLSVPLSRCVTVTCRSHWGTQALGLPCALAVVVMLLWYMCTQDEWLFIWMGVWALCFIKCRVEAVRLAATGKVHSKYDGYPFDAIRIGKTEKNAKMYVEPLLFGVLGVTLFWFYTDNDWSPTGLPYFLIAAAFSTGFLEAVKQTVWDKRLQDVADAQIDNELMMRDYHDKFGTN